MTLERCKDFLERQEHHEAHAAQEYLAMVQELALEREEARAAQEVYLLCRRRYHCASLRIAEYEDQVRALQEEIVEEQICQEQIAKKEMEHEEHSARITFERIEYLQDVQSAARKDIDDEGLSEYLAQANRNAGPIDHG